MSSRKCVKSCGTRRAALTPAGMPVGAARGAASGLLRMLKKGKDVRSRKVCRLRAAVEAGTYENSLKLSVALDRLLEEVGG